MVNGDGDPSAQLVIIGEHPGPSEIREGRPFCGGSGVALFQQLRDRCKINRLDCYVTNVNKDDSEGFSYRWTEVLEQELDNLPNKKVLLLLGGVALQAVVGERSITNWRGSPIWSDRFNCWCIAANNPAMLFRDPSLRPIFSLDIAKVGRLLSGTYKPFEQRAILYPTVKEAWDYIDMLEREEKPIAFDIETIAKETACIGFTNSLTEGMCIAWRNSDEAVYDTETEIRLMRRIQRMFNNKRLRFVAQNGNFDRYWLWFKDRIQVKQIWFDTMLAHHTLYSTLPHNLGFLTSQYTMHPFYKDEGKDWREGGDINAFWRYNVKDVCTTLEVQQAIIRELEAQKMSEFFFSHVMRLAQELPRMTVHGVKCDLSLKDEIYTQMEKDIAAMKVTFFEQVQAITGKQGYTPNPNSPAAMGILMYQDFGLPMQGSKPKTDKDTRAFFISHPNTPPAVQECLTTLNRYVKEHKFFSTYVKMEVDYDGRLRCDYKQTGVQRAPGRLSSGKTLWGSGGNLQNQPTAAQRMVIADPDYEFSYVDGSQAEARLVARLWNVKGLLENFEKAASDKTFDVHRANATRIFRKPYDEIPAYDRDPETDEITLRFLGKRCVHGLNYRMSAERLAETCGIPLGQAQEAYYAYHRAFPEIQVGWRKTVEEATRTKMLMSPFGRRLYFLGVDFEKDDDALDSCIAFKPQSTVGDWVASLIYKCHADPEWPHTARICLNVHDAIIALNRIEDGPTVRKILRRHGEQPIHTPTGPVIIPFEAKRSVPDEKGLHRWSNLTKCKEGE